MFNVPNDVMETFALIVPTLAVLAYTIPVFTNVLADTDNTFNWPASTDAPATFNVPNDVMETFALIVPTLAVLAYTIPVLTKEFAVIENVLIDPEMLARPAFNSMLAVIVPLNKLVLAMIVPILAEPASKRPLTLAELAFSCVLAVIMPPITLVTADKVPTFAVLA
jgi:hypothetical protein